MTYADVIQTITALATIVGLILVIIGLQQTRKSINAATYEHILDREADNWNQVRAGDLSVRANALRHFGISVSEKSYDSDMDVLIDQIALFNFYEGLFFLHRQGAVNEEVWLNWRRSLINTMKDHAIRNSWEKVKNVYNPLFMEFIAREAPLQAEAK